MDWIERVFHVSLDGGNGSVELVIYLVISFAAAGAVARVWRRRRR